MGCKMCTDAEGNPTYVGCGPGDPCGSLVAVRKEAPGTRQEHLFTVYVEKDKPRPDVKLVPQGCDPPDDGDYEDLGTFTMITVAGLQKKNNTDVPAVKVQFPSDPK